MVYFGTLTQKILMEVSLFMQSNCIFFSFFSSFQESREKLKRDFYYYGWNFPPVPLIDGTFYSKSTCKIMGIILLILERRIFVFKQISAENHVTIKHANKIQFNWFCFHKKNFVIFNQNARLILHRVVCQNQSNKLVQSFSIDFTELKANNCLWIAKKILLETIYLI